MIGSASASAGWGCSAASEDFSQDCRTRAFQILGGRDEHDLVASLLTQRGQRHRAQRSECLPGRESGQLFPVATVELREALGDMSVPLTQLLTGSDVLRPLVEGGVLSRDAPRPEPVDQDPDRAQFDFVVDASNGDRNHLLNRVRFSREPVGPLHRAQAGPG